MNNPSGMRLVNKIIKLVKRKNPILTSTIGMLLHPITFTCWHTEDIRNNRVSGMTNPANFLGVNEDGEVSEMKKTSSIYTIHRWLSSQLFCVLNDGVILSVLSNGMLDDVFFEQTLVIPGLLPTVRLAEPVEVFSIKLKQGKQFIHFVGSVTDLLEYSTFAEFANAVTAKL